MNEALIDLLRHDLDAADYRAGAVRALLGAEAEAAEAEDAEEESAEIVKDRGERRLWLEERNYRAIDIREADVLNDLDAVLARLTLEVKA